MSLRTKLNVGFSMIELMIVLVIIGMLSTIAIPAYNKYVQNAKMAEGYVGMDNMVKLETAYYYANGIFVFVGQNPAGLPHLKKKPVDAQLIGTYWPVLGYPFPVGADSTFSYTGCAGRTNATAAQDFSDPRAPCSVGFFGTKIGAGDATISLNCINPASTADYVSSFTGKANYHWAVVHAAANILPDDDITNAQCTKLVRGIETVNGVLQTRGLVVMRE
ncbi:MAG: prepilin-type N-terminal cleavage/methylation domain-containing protein [Proteobacteria bacterium]|jgi:prepilin-type N-terminal cleavage/methylation domain-containing protein|nr:prepilin-type N-terminal cleavage/methylation domain-containing protein [Pseudomonadota bacterium]